MHYGLTQFGRPLAASLVTAAGIAVCAANATASARKTRVAGGAASAIATVALSPKRTATAHPRIINCAATASGQGATQFCSISGLASALAQVSGRSQVDFVAAASAASAHGRATAKPLRRARAFARQASAFATIEGEGYIFELAYPSPARATAWGFGTTYQTGHGGALATAAIRGNASWASGGAGCAEADSVVSGVGAYTGGGQGVGVGKAIAWADAAVRRSGIRYFEGVGIAEAIANGLLTTLTIYQSQTAHARAYLVQSSIQTRGARGCGNAHADATAEALVVGTAATLLIGSTHATATGRVRLEVRGRGTGRSSAACAGSPLVRRTKSYGVPANAFASISGSAIVRSTKAHPDTAYGAADITGRVSRIIVGRGTPAAALATARDAAFTRTRVAVGVALAVAKAACTPRKALVFAGYAEAFAFGDNSCSVFNVFGTAADARAEIRAIAHRIRFARGAGSAAATMTGYNQINDLLRAPEVRTLVVEASPRLLGVPAEIRFLAA